MSEKKWSFTFLCEKTNELVHVDNSKSTFTCPECNLTLHWIESARKLGAHGKEDRTIGHEMRVAKEA